MIKVRLRRKLDSDHRPNFPLVDLRVSNKGAHADNEALVQGLQSLSEHIKKQRAATSDAAEKKRHGFRLAQVSKAIRAIEECAFRIVSGTQAQKLSGIGKGIAQRVDEILTTGKLQEVAESLPPETQAIMELSQVHGIGEVTARRLVEFHGVSGLSDLRHRLEVGSLREHKNELTHAIVLGLRYFEDLKHRIPREEIQEFERLLSMAVSRIGPGVTAEICGSYRRRCSTSGDIDVLVTSEVPILPELLEELRKNGIIVDDLTVASTKYMGFCRIRSGLPVRRLDMRHVTRDSRAAALMYFTGSQRFNVLFRQVALVRGYTLNEYGLYKVSSGVKEEEKVPAQDERELFDLVGVVYLEPWEREL
ncbi:MAG: type-X family DNA polymerase [Sulfobacillus sp.]